LWRKGLMKGWKQGVAKVRTDRENGKEEECLHETKQKRRLPIVYFMQMLHHIKAEKEFIWRSCAVAQPFRS
jgi:hypothetical protein